MGPMAVGDGVGVGIGVDDATAMVAVGSTTGPGVAVAEEPHPKTISRNDVARAVGHFFILRLIQDRIIPALPIVVDEGCGQL